MTTTRLDKINIALATAASAVLVAFLWALGHETDPNWGWAQKGVWYYAFLGWCAVGFWLSFLVVRQALRNLRHPQESAPKEPQTTSRKPYFDLDTIRRANDALMGGARRRGEPYEIYVGNGLGRVKIPRPTREEIAEAGRKALANHYKRKDKQS